MSFKSGHSSLITHYSLSLLIIPLTSLDEMDWSTFRRCIDHCLLFSLGFYRIKKYVSYRH